MTLQKLIHALWRRKWVILLTTVITTLVVFLGTRFYSFTYEASTTLRVATTRTGQASYEDLLYADRLLKTFAEIANTPSVKEELLAAYELEEEPTITVQVLPNTELIRISIAHPDPITARDLANTLAAIVIRRSQEIDNRLNAITIVDPAVTPRETTVSRMIVLAAGVLVGLVGGLGLAIVFEYLDERMFNSLSIEEVSELPLLGRIPSVKESQSVLRDKKSPRYYEEAFRILRTNLFELNHQKPLKALLITSADPGDGKSTTLFNLAAAIAETGNKVVIIDGDMRKPKLHTLCHLSNEMGLSSLLEGKGQLADAVQSLEPNLSVITSGPPPGDPALLLTLDHAGDLIKTLKKSHDFVLIDSPSILAVPDARLLARHVDSLILIVNKTTTTRAAILGVTKSLTTIPVRPLGMVINKADLDHGYYYYQK